MNKFLNKTDAIELMEATADELNMMRSKRLRMLRALSGLSRNEFQEKFNIASSTLTSWENAKVALTAKGANKLISAMKECNIECSEEWLLYGVGIGPHLLDGSNKVVDKIDRWICQSSMVSNEVQYFLSLGPNRAIQQLRDNSMMPFYSKNDIVGGVVCTGPDIRHLINKNVIVTLANGNTFVKFLAASTKDSLYTLVSSNREEGFELVHDAKVVAAAEIIWHRKVT